MCSAAESSREFVFKTTQRFAQGRSELLLKEFAGVSWCDLEVPRVTSLPAGTPLTLKSVALGNQIYYSPQEIKFTANFPTLNRTGTLICIISPEAGQTITFEDFLEAWSPSLQQRD